MDIAKQINEISISEHHNKSDSLDQAKIEADDKLVNYVAQTMEEAELKAAEIINKAKRDSDRESSLIISLASEMAKRITEKAEQDAKERAREITELEVKNIIAQAQTEAGMIIERAKRFVETHHREKADDSIVTNDLIIEIGSKYQQNQPVRQMVKGGNVQEINNSPTPLTETDPVMEDSEYTLALGLINDSRPIEGSSESQASPVILSTDEGKTYQGKVKIHIPIPVAYEKLIRLREKLLNVAGLRLESIGGSKSGDTTVAVFLEEPMPLASILAGIPIVRYAFDEGEDIVVLLQPNVA